MLTIAIAVVVMLAMGLGAYGGWWARSRVMLETVPIPIPQPYQPGTPVDGQLAQVPTAPPSLQNPYADPGVVERMTDDLVAKKLAAGEFVDRDEMHEHVRTLLQGL